MKTIALIAHDRKKQEMIAFVKEHLEILQGNTLVATATTGKLIGESTHLTVRAYLSGPLGGDLQIGALIANQEVDLVIFLRDPLAAQPHEPDITALLRVCDVHNIPVATNVASGRLLLRSLVSGSKQ
ncbi:methylglyoxal synthase [Acetonema longum]|uniref:Methylglyoxal synthase n=1 Tax=Acetonema longum DSM 6540 TaxID=1009370 RepID=F7NLC7_9FIRM|nr:methylglyoxal synthase [Acetonema longum]EGO63232.1 methylglyoxal synthase [Acetonema longum DSM 6540]